MTDVTLPPVNVLRGQWAPTPAPAPGPGSGLSAGHDASCMHMFPVCVRVYVFPSISARMCPQRARCSTCTCTRTMYPYVQCSSHSRWRNSCPAMCSRCHAAASSCPATRFSSPASVS